MQSDQCNGAIQSPLSYLNAWKTQCSSYSRFYFAHVVKGTLKGTDHTFALHSIFEIIEYFIQMNNKYAFFLYWVMLALLSSLLLRLSVC